MASRPLLISCLFLTNLLLVLSSSRRRIPKNIKCSFGGDAMYTANSTYEINLNTLLRNLSSSTSSAGGFLASTSGSVPNRAYGLALCRGDVDSSTCSSCLDSVSTNLTQYCPYHKNAAMLHDDCLLRYADAQFAGTVTYNNRQFFWNRNNISSPDAARFHDSVMAVLNGLRSNAVSNATGPRLFAAGEMDIGGIGGYEKVYGLVQCTRDITAGDCGTCLEAILEDLPICCFNSIGAKVLAASCILRYEVSPFYNWTGRLVFPGLVRVPLPAPTPDTTSPVSPEKKKKSAGLFIGISIPSGVVLILLIFISYFCLRGRNKNKLSDDGVSESLLINHAVVICATNNFSDKLGEGGFGAVYKGTLPNGQEIAVKRILRGSFQGIEQLKNEIVLLKKLQHRNLVRLLGVCLEGDEKLLVYEFVPNKSLDTILFDSERKKELDWKARYKIITGIARGLLYLHEESQVTIIHRDLKASNILLDIKLNPKISDFGIARLFVCDQTHANTNTVVGTFGYMSPEYLTTGQFSHKSDIYSFGVLVLEIITGRKCSDFCNSENSEFSTDLPSYAWEHWSSGSVPRIVDPSLRGNYEEDEAQRCIQMALLCVQEQPDERPMMSSVVLMLNSCSISMHVPAMPASAGDYSRTGYRRQAPLPRAPYIDTSITELEPR